MKRAFFVAVYALIIMCASSPLAQAGDRELEKQLNWKYGDKVLTLRHFFKGDHLKFLSDGRPSGNSEVGPWTLYGRIVVKTIQVKGRVLEVKARRVRIVFDPKALTNKVPTPLDQLTMLDSLTGKQRNETEKFLRKLDVTIEIDFPSSDPTNSDADSTMQAVFFMPEDSMVDAVPTHWRSYFASLEGRPESYSHPPAEKVVSAKRAPHSISPPRAILHNDPQFSDEARKAKYQGTMVLWLIVDPNGQPKDIQIITPLGLGLDEKAVDAVSQWKFEPARRDDGDPVAVQINVEVSFRLY
jgi:TonB family protein